MATKSSIHIKPCNIASSEAHNRRTAENMRHIGESRIYVVPELSTGNKQWINPDFGSPDLRTHYDNIRQMVKEKTGRAMQEKELSRLARIIDKAFRWFPMFREMLRIEKFCATLGFTKEMTESLLVKKKALKCSGKIYSEQHRRNFDVKDDILMIENDHDDESRLNLTINRKPIADWFMEQWHKLRYGTRLPQQEEKKSRGIKM